MADYDVSSIKVDPNGLTKHSDTLTNLSSEVSSLVNQMQNSLATLVLLWAGKTADESQQFYNRWDGVMDELFGTQDKNDKNPSHAGVLNVMSGHLKNVSDAFSAIESGLAGGFKALSDDMSKPAPPYNPNVSSTPTSAPDNVNDPDNIAVIEKWK